MERILGRETSVFGIKVGKLKINDFARVAHITAFGVDLSGEERVDDGEEENDRHCRDTQGPGRACPQALHPPMPSASGFWNLMWNQIRVQRQLCATIALEPQQRQTIGSEVRRRHDLLHFPPIQRV